MGGNEKQRLGLYFSTACEIGQRKVVYREKPRNGASAGDKVPGVPPKKS